jgi:hypothetical protein
MPSAVCFVLFWEIFVHNVCVGCTYYALMSSKYLSRKSNATSTPPALLYTAVKTDRESCGLIPEFGLME